MPGFHKENFINFLEETLIPDLIESGNDFTATDFIRAVCFMKDKDLNYIDDRSIEMLANKYKK